MKGIKKASTRKKIPKSDDTQYKTCLASLKNKNDTKKECTKKEQLLSCSFNNETLYEQLKALLDMEEKDDASKMLTDFCLKFLRKLIDEIEGNDKADCKKLVSLYQCVYCYLEEKLRESNCLQEEMFEKCMKIVFHISKQFYKKMEEDGLIVSNNFLECLMSYSRKEYFKEKDELKKILHTVHQMSYSLYIKLLQQQQSTNKKQMSNFTELFVLRASSLTILLFSDWKENKFVELCNDFLQRWTKMLSTNSVSFKEGSSSTLKFIHCLTSTLRTQKHIELDDILSKTIYFLLFILKIDINSTEYYDIVKELEQLKNHLPHLKECINFYMVSLEMSAQISNDDGKCFCGMEIRTKFLSQFSSFVKEKQALVQFCNVINTLRGRAKNNASSCAKRLFLELSCNVLRNVRNGNIDEQRIRDFSCTQILYVLQDFDEKISQEREKDDCLQSKNLVREYQKHLKSVKTFILESIEYLEPIVLQSLCSRCYKVSMKFYNEKNYTQAVDALSIAFQLKMKCPTPKDVFLHVKQVSMMSSAIVSCFYYMKDYKSSYHYLMENMKFIIGNLNIEENESDCKALFQTQIEHFVKLKKQLSASNEEMLHRCIHEELHDVDRNYSLWITLSSLEIDVCRAQSSQYEMDESLKKLILFQKDLYEEQGEFLEYSFCMIKLSAVRCIKPENRLEWCQEALDMLEGMVGGQEECDDVMMTQCKTRDVLAIAYFQQAMIIYEQMVANTDHVTEKLDDVTDKINDVIDKQCDTWNGYELRDFFQSDFILSINNALETWLSIEEYIKQSDECEDIKELFLDASYSAQCLNEMAMFYSLLSQNFKAIQASYVSSLIYEQLYRTEGKKDSQEMKLCSWTFIGTQFLFVENLEVAEWVLQLLEEQDIEKDRSLFGKVQLLKAAVHIQKGETEEGGKMLNTFMTSEVSEKNTRRSLLFRSEVFLLLSSLKLQVNGNYEIVNQDHHFPVNSPLPPAMDSLKYLRSLFEDDCGNVFSRWVILDKLLISLFHYGKLLKQQGSVRQAKAYFKEALLLSKKYQLSFRVLDALENISSLDLMLRNCESFEDNFKTLTTIADASVNGCFKGDDVYLPDFVEHCGDCDCNYCSNSKLQQSHINLFLQYVKGRKTFYESKKSFVDTVNVLTWNANVRHQRLLDQVKEMIGFNSNSRTKKGKKKKAQNIVEVPMFSKLSTEAELYDRESCETSSDVIDTIENLIAAFEQKSAAQEYYTGMHDLYRLVAKLYYLRGLLYAGKEVFALRKGKNSVSEDKAEGLLSIDEGVVSGPKREENDDIKQESKDPDNRKLTTRRRKGKQLENNSRTRRCKNAEVNSCDEEEVEIEIAKIKSSTARGGKKGSRIKQSSKESNKISKLTKQPSNQSRKNAKKPEEQSGVSSHLTSNDLLEDLKRVLKILNPFTDTLMIKLIYELISWTSYSQKNLLTINTQCLASSRTLHQQYLNTATRKLRKGSEVAQDVCAEEAERLIRTSELIEKFSAPDFVFGEVSAESVLKEKLHDDWTVCCLSMTELNGSQFMTISRISKHEKSLVVKIKLDENIAVQKSDNVVCDLASAFDESIQEKFRQILEQSKASMNIKDKKSWWSERTRLDYKMKCLLTRIENKYLYCWKGLMLGKLLDHTLGNKIDELTQLICEGIEKTLKISIDAELIKVMVDSFDFCTESQILTCFEQLCEKQHQETVFEIFMKQYKKYQESNSQYFGKKTFRRRKPIILILDKMVQAFPWESIPLLKNQPVVRMPSLVFTAAMSENYQEYISHGFKPKDIYYILNPRKDLKRTEDMFSEWFQREKWEGITGTAPTKDEYIHAVTNNDVFIYCGHGSGQEYLGWNELQRVRCKAVALLMGCCSGKLVAHGTLEAHGMAQYYLIAGSPAVVANLWDVTDKDIDSFLQQLLKLWLTEPDGRDLSECVAEARQICKLEYLIGAAPVVYGLPLVVNKKK